VATTVSPGAPVRPPLPSPPRTLLSDDDAAPVYSSLQFRSNDQATDDDDDNNNNNNVCRECRRRLQPDDGTVCVTFNVIPSRQSLICALILFVHRVK